MDTNEPKPGISWFFYPEERRGDGKLIMLHAHHPRWLVVNETTREIAGLLENGGGERDEAAARLIGKYGISEAEARRDIDQVADQLTRQGFLGPQQDRPSERSPVLDTFFIHITGQCNYACDHCYQARGKPAPHMGYEAACRLIDEAAACGAREITISGGEPLLHPRARDLVRRAAGKMGVRLLTNGSLLDQGWAELLAEINALVQVSLDGADPATHDTIRQPGSFDAAWRAVARLQDAGMAERVNLSATVMEQNLGQLPEILRMAEQRGVPLVRFLPLSRRGRASDNWERIGAGLSVEDQEAFYRLVAGKERSGHCSVDVSCGLSGFLLEVGPAIAPDGIWCPVGRILVVDADGSAYPCVLMMEERFRLGNAMENGLQSCLEHQGLAEACGFLVDRRRRIPECAACHWRNLCQGGCMGQALDNRGSIWDRDDFCSYRQEAYQDAFDAILTREGSR